MSEPTNSKPRLRLVLCSAADGRMLAQAFLRGPHDPTLEDPSRELEQAAIELLAHLKASKKEGGAH